MWFQTILVAFLFAIPISTVLKVPQPAISATLIKNARVSTVKVFNQHGRKQILPDQRKLTKIMATPGLLDSARNLKLPTYEQAKFIALYSKAESLID